MRLTAAAYQTIVGIGFVNFVNLRRLSLAFRMSGIVVSVFLGSPSPQWPIGLQGRCSAHTVLFHSQNNAMNKYSSPSLPTHTHPGPQMR